jgi:hypothetical protein
MVLYGERKEQQTDRVTLFWVFGFRMKPNGCKFFTLHQSSTLKRLPRQYTSPFGGTADATQRLSPSFSPVNDG